MRVAPDPAEISEIYIDESSQNSHRFLVLGGVMVRFFEREALCSHLMHARLPDLPAKEAKWVKVSSAKLPAYKRFVDVFFDHVGLAHFHCLVIDTSRQNHRAYNQGSHEIGFNKEIYQLAIKFSRLYPDRLFHVYPDHRNAAQPAEELRRILNNGCRKSGDKRDYPFRRCQFRNSAKTLPLQLVDVLIGAIAWNLNGHANRPDASSSKEELSAHVLKRAGIRDAKKDTARAGKFTIWHRQLRK